MHKISVDELQLLTGMAAYKMALIHSDPINSYCSFNKLDRETFFAQAIMDRINKSTKVPPQVEGMFNKREVCRLDDIRDKAIAETLKKHAQRYSSVARLLIADASKHVQGWTTTRYDLQSMYGVGFRQLGGILSLLEKHKLIEVERHQKKIVIHVKSNEDGPFDMLKAIAGG